MDYSIIDRKAKSLRDRDDHLAGLLRDLDAEVEAIRAARITEIKSTVRLVAEKHSELKAAIAKDSALFTKPRTIVLHGYKVGFGKQRGGIVIVNKDTTVDLIEKHFPKKKDLLIKTTKSPLKKALGQLTVDELKKVGCEVKEAGDGVVIIPVDSAVEKQISAMLKALINDGTDEEEGE